jgi:hypothetical protein
METASKTRLLWSAPVAAAVAGIAVAAAAVLMPLDLSAPASRQAAAIRPASRPAVQEGADAALTLEELQPLCSRSLRAPWDLPAAGEAAPSAGPLAVKVTGVAQEPGKSMAFLQKADGTVEIVAEGEHLATGPLVKSISPRVVVLEHQGQTVELPVPQPAP